jgi:YhcH/YjgK/YiaL family protein
MILDVLGNSGHYAGLPRQLVAAFDFLRTADLAGLPLGKTVIDGERLFALTQEYTPKPAPLLKFEAHRRYWDVQYVVSGVERMGWNTRERMTVSESHDAERDVAFFRGEGDFFRVPAGTFAIFGPSDVHMPGVAAGEGESIATTQNLVRKVVLKVDLSM